MRIIKDLAIVIENSAKILKDSTKVLEYSMRVINATFSPNYSPINLQPIM